MPAANLHGLVVRVQRRGAPVTAAWWAGGAVGFDYETDGKDPSDARIISCNMTTLAGSGDPPASHDWVVQPEREIPQEAIDVHGITTEHAREHGKPRDVAVVEMIDVLQTAGEDAPVVGHNLAYDLTVLDREMRRLGIGSLGPADGLVTIRRDGRELARFPVIDTLVLDKALDRYRKGPPEGGRNKLPEVARVYGVDLGSAGAHDASADVLGALRIAWRMACMCTWPASRLAEHYADRKRPSELAIAFGGLADMSLLGLHALQTKWAAEQADSFRQYVIDNPKYAAEKDINPDDITGDWPFRPFV